MNIKRLVVIGVLLSMLAIPMVASAAVTYTTGFQVQNLSATVANIMVTYYKQDGTVEATVNDTVPGSGSKTYFPLSGVSSGFNGSAVVSSDQQVTAIVNVLGNNGSAGSTNTLADSYASFAQGGAPVNLPLVMKGNYGINTWFNVQNTGSAVASVTVTYAPGTCTESKTIQPNASATFDQSTNSCMGTKFVGAASISSTQPIVAAVMQVGPSNLLGYTGFSSASTNPIMPLISSGYYGSGTGVQVQNTGASSTNVTISYSPSAGFPGSACTETRTVPAGQSVTFAYPTFPAACGTSFVGSGKVTVNSASMPLVAIVNQVTAGKASASAYNAINPSNATGKVSLPLIMDRNYNIFTGFSIANVGTQATQVACTFSNTSYSIPATTVQPGQALTPVQLNMISPGYVGSANCTATGGDALIAGIVNQLTNGAPATTDALLTYPAYNY